MRFLLSLPEPLLCAASVSCWLRLRHCAGCASILGVLSAGCDTLGMAIDLDKLNWLLFDPRNAAEVAYSGGDLYVKWAKGGAGMYAGVSVRDWDALMRSRGSGQMFVSLIRSRYSYTRLE